MRFLPTALACIGAAVLSLPALAVADYMAEVKVEGVLLDTELHRLPGVTVSVRSAASGKEWKVQSDELGRFDVGLLPLGEYKFQGHSADGTELFDVNYNVGERIVTTSSGDKAEQIFIVVGRGVRSMHAEPGTKAKQDKAPQKATLPGHAGPSRGNINVILGGRNLDDNWQPMDDQTAFGIRVDHEFRSFPLHLVYGLHGSSDDSTDLGQPFHLSGNVDMDVTELSFGVMKLWDRAKRFRHYISTGASLVHVNLEADDFDHNDDSLGVFLEVGMYWQLSRGFNIGLDTRHLLLTDLELGHADVDVNYFQVGLLAGWGW